MATLKISRSGSMVGLVVPWDVYIDGNKAGKLKNGKTIELEVAPGTHTVHVSTAQWFSNEVSFVIDDEHPNAAIECSIVKPGSKAASAAAFGAIGAAISNSEARRKGENQINAVLVQ
jgi:hypothetical protein